MKPIKEHDLVRLKIPEKLRGKIQLFGNIHDGDLGTVVHIYSHASTMCEVEFPQMHGNTMTMPLSLLEPVETKGHP